MRYALVRDPATGEVSDTAVRCLDDGSTIFADDASLYWRAYLAWCAAGNVPDPPPPALAIGPTVTGNQFAFALGNLGLAAAWRAGVARSKDKDQIRAGLIGRTTPLVVTDPLLIRVAANAGLDATGAPLIDIPTVFAKALTEPT